MGKRRPTIPADGTQGFALVVAVAVLSILVYSSVAVQHASLGEVGSVREAVARTRAELALKGALEVALADLNSFLAGAEGERTLQAAIGLSACEVRMRKTTAAEVGPALGHLPPDRPLVELNLTGIQQRKAPGGNAGPSVAAVQQRATAIVDPAKIPYRIILWMPERPPGE